ncbi:hypothetical protein FVEG_14880 [Fusarium verticillioides 7600]|uniref:Uncharacterized protein n=1 Tax=Gibberella moniliformis (strain M3125 / FGSC 7600) TaxID=334819 RepID=W7LSD0_GIBM7|nr:hypothetical protein FVEG_14880 [Fusarium verticillioides 7600]EWG38399.1 hypothetical protein FVEG_14880 [Fusarium verticillioides 7600]
MCTEVVHTWECTVCSKDFKSRRDYTLCKVGRKENKWGACKKYNVQHEYWKDKCGACAKKK